MTQKKRPAPLVLVAIACCLLTFAVGIGFGLQGQKPATCPVVSDTNGSTDDLPSVDEEPVTVEPTPESTDTEESRRLSEKYWKFYMKEAKRHPRLTAAEIDDKWNLRISRSKHN